MYAMTVTLTTATVRERAYELGGTCENADGLGLPESLSPNTVLDCNLQGQVTRAYSIVPGSISVGDSGARRRLGTGGS